jgi:hypothetical protein
MSKTHRIKFTTEGNSWTAKLLMDGHEVQASKLEFSCGVDGLPIVVITLPTAALDIEGNAVVQLIQPVAIPGGH